MVPLGGGAGERRGAVAAPVLGPTGAALPLAVPAHHHLEPRAPGPLGGDGSGGSGFGTWMTARHR